jgi:hypothetical protein
LRGKNSALACPAIHNLLLFTEWKAVMGPAGKKPLAALTSAVRAYSLNRDVGGFGCFACMCCRYVRVYSLLHIVVDHCVRDAGLGWMADRSGEMERTFLSSFLGLGAETMEGSEVIDECLVALKLYHAQGLRYPNKRTEQGHYLIVAVRSQDSFRSRTYRRTNDSYGCLAA